MSMRILAIVIRLLDSYTQRNSFTMCNKQAKTLDRKYPEDPFRTIERTEGFHVSLLLSSTGNSLVICREKKRGHGKTRRGKTDEETFETNGEGSKAGK